MISFNNEVTFFSNKIVMEQKIQKNAPASGVVYGLGFIGAAIYFISHATGFWLGVLGFPTEVFYKKSHI